MRHGMEMPSKQTRTLSGGHLASGCVVPNMQAAHLLGLHGDGRVRRLRLAAVTDAHPGPSSRCLQRPFSPRRRWCGLAASILLQSCAYRADNHTPISKLEAAKDFPNLQRINLICLAPIRQSSGCKNAVPPVR